MNMSTKHALGRKIVFRAVASLSVLFWLAGHAAEVAHGQPAEPDKIAEVERGERDTANAAWWGFDLEDSTETLQAAFDSGARTVVIPDTGSDWIVRPLELRSDQTVFFEDGVRLLAKEGEFHGRSDSMLRGENLENIRLIGYGAEIQMRKEDYMSEDYVDAEWRMCIALYSCRNVEIKGLTLSDSGGDGIYLGNLRENGVRPYNEDVTIRDVVCENNYRQGLSVISARNLLVENSAFNRTSGTGPSAGIDLEPNRPDEELTNVVIRNCVFIDNENLGMHMWFGHVTDESPPIDVLWEGNYVRGGRVGIHVNDLPRGQSSGEVVYRGNIVEDSEHAGILVRRTGVDTAHLRFEDLVLYNTAWREGSAFGGDSAPIALNAQWDTEGTYDRQGGLTFTNVHVINEELGGRPVLRVNGNDAFEAWDDVEGVITATVLDGQGYDEVNAPLGERFSLELNPGHSLNR